MVVLEEALREELAQLVGKALRGELASLRSSLLQDFEEVLDQRLSKPLAPGQRQTAAPHPGRPKRPKVLGAGAGAGGAAAPLPISKEPVRLSDERSSTNSALPALLALVPTLPTGGQANDTESVELAKGPAPQIAGGSRGGGTVDDAGVAGWCGGEDAEGGGGGGGAEAGGSTTLSPARGSTGATSMRPISHLWRRWTSFEQMDPKKQSYRSNTMSLISANLGGSKGPRELVAKVVESIAFDYTVAMFILANAASIGLQADYMARNNLAEPPVGYATLDLFFCILFTVELALRVFVHGLSFFTMKGWQWSVIDATVVALQLLEEVFKSAATTQFSMLRMLRLIRIIRVIRIFRLLSELHTIVISIMGSLRSLFWTLVLLLLGIYVLGVYFTELVLDHRLTHINDVESSADDAKLNQYYGDLFRSILALYQAMSGGVDWDDICGPLISRISWMQGVIFCLYIAFTVLALMNVVTGVFVEGAIKGAKKDEAVLAEKILWNMFHIADEDGNGLLSKDEFMAQLGLPETQNYLRSVDVDLGDANALLELLDKDGSGQIDYQEFVQGCLHLRGAAKAIDIISVLHVCRDMQKELGDLRGLLPGSDSGSPMPSPKGGITSLPLTAEDTRPSEGGGMQLPGAVQGWAEVGA